jgi:hypothetical protein
MQPPLPPRALLGTEELVSPLTSCWGLRLKLLPLKSSSQVRAGFLASNLWGGAATVAFTKPGA